MLLINWFIKLKRSIINVFLQVVSSAKSLTEDSKLLGRSFMYIRTSNGPKIEPCGTPANTNDQFEHWPLRSTL